jgi:hypothetical protein
MRIRHTVVGATATARLCGTAAARGFAGLLPVTIMVHDLGAREKSGPPARDLADGQGRSGCRAGQLGYWASSHDLAIYYHEDCFQIPPRASSWSRSSTQVRALRHAGGNARLTIERIGS